MFRRTLRVFSCIVQFGDGEVIDVERKNELAGNIHGQRNDDCAGLSFQYLRFALANCHFSASLVFEQSYGEIEWR
ncbi:protease La [Haemophilus influenzae]|uniref:Protease La n=1 Tax=Haemophilus influenzae TaxID=727 RepID=A0A2X1PSS4_HAEIF|nr:protease La [Haemophilus influenzae]